jgi:NHL repeat
MTVSRGEYVSQFGYEGVGSGQFRRPETIAADSAGNLYVVDNRNARVEEFSPAGTFLATFATLGSGEGQLNDPLGVTINAAGDMYIADGGNNRVQEWVPDDQAVHDTKTIYYTAKEEAEISACRNHPEWAGMICQTEPAAQPASGPAPEVPVSTATAYNIWDEAETTTEKIGSVTRTKSETYDPAGRALTSEESTSPATGQPLPKTTVEYNKETGAVEKQSATIKGETKTITSRANTLGQLTEDTDAEGNLAKYTYEEGSDGRLLEESESKGKEAESKQTYSYDPTTGLLTKLIDSAAGTFTASYDLEGRLTSEIYPNGMCQNTVYNPVGEATNLQYIKTRNCSESNPTVWFSDAIVPSIHGETLTQTSTLAKESYTYDNAGRLTEAQETPAGKDCASRVYAYDEEGDRTAEITRQSSSETCPSEGGDTEHHVYDPADRLIDEGIAYEALGNITTMPAADAGGHELASTYYVDNQVYTQKQNGETLTYTYDPAGRTMQTVSEGKTAAKTISHYAGPGEAVTWTSEGTETWSRNIPGIDGTLTATQKSGEAPVLQLHDLQGDIVATAGLSESETKLASTYNSTEFGVPQPGTTPPKYAWLGADGISTEKALESGLATKGGASYVPQVARNLQTVPVIPPGIFPNGTPGTYYTSIVTAGELKSAEEEAVTVTRQAEEVRQKTKEQEAAETLAKCREAGGCGCEASPESCGAVDPSHILGLFTPQESIEIGEALCNCAAVHAIGAAIETVMSHIHVEGAGEVVERILESGLAEGFGKLLLACGEYLSSNGNNRCALEMDTWEIPGIGVDSHIPTKITVGICFYYKKSFEGKKVGLHCPNGAYYKKGSY